MIGLDGRPFDWNDAAADLLGFDEPQLRALTFADAVHPDQRAEITRALDDLIAGRAERHRCEVQLVGHGDTRVWGNLALSAVRDGTGSARFVVAMAEDVTQQKLAEEQLRQAQKMDAIGQLTAGIAHDFNNLLMGVIGYTELLRATAHDGSATATHLDRIDQSAKRAAKLTQQLLAFGRRQTLQPRELDLNEQLRDGVELLGRVLGEHIEISVDLAPDLARLRADPTQIHQVLVNLALNARDAMPEGGQLRFATANEGGMVRLTVCDTGCGMTPAIRDRIFDPFFTTKGVGEGSGLGLSSVYGIIVQSGGEIAVESEPGAGTTFTIHLPALAVQ
jgi:PAS domain S-box-containing protein